jgi:hypothetical protein
MVLLYAGVLEVADDELRAEGERRSGEGLLVIGREEKEVEVGAGDLIEGVAEEEGIGEAGLDSCMPRTCKGRREEASMDTCQLEALPHRRSKEDQAILPASSVLLHRRDM